eukprot:TRINITY_DN612_c0_g2_i1.p1 TRINITY_DN612_c0_g2~~TRINITY_DN612_c0_g2_i1.p1  ORF type:complete len:471 (-),score=120.51 TRINITY_DN612_c0_g2_i1:92-1504(-)
MTSLLEDVCVLAGVGVNRYRTQRERMHGARALVARVADELAARDAVIRRSQDIAQLLRERIDDCSADSTHESVALTFGNTQWTLPRTLLARHTPNWIDGGPIQKTAALSSADTVDALHALFALLQRGEIVPADRLLAVLLVAESSQSAALAKRLAEHHVSPSAVSPHKVGSWYALARRLEATALLAVIVRRVHTSWHAVCASDDFWSECDAPLVAKLFQLLDVPAHEQLPPPSDSVHGWHDALFTLLVRFVKHIAGDKNVTTAQALTNLCASMAASSDDQVDSGAWKKLHELTLENTIYLVTYFSVRQKNDDGNEDEDEVVEESVNSNVQQDVGNNNDSEEKEIEMDNDDDEDKDNVNNDDDDDDDDERSTATTSSSSSSSTNEFESVVRRGLRRSLKRQRTDDAHVPRETAAFLGGVLDYVARELIGAATSSGAHRITPAAVSNGLNEDSDLQALVRSVMLQRAPESDE